MSRFLPILLSINLLLSSFSISPNPFTNKSIQYNKFASVEQAMMYYYMEINDNQISYSKSDLFAMICVLAHLRISEDITDVNPDLIYDVDQFFAKKDNYFSYISSFITVASLRKGYILKGINVPTIAESFLDFISTSHNWNSNKALHFFDDLFTNLKFVKEGFIPSETLDQDIDDFYENVTGDKPYVLLPVRPTSDLTSIDPSSFYTRNLYESFLYDLQSFSSEHDYYSCIFFSSYYRLNFNLTTSDYSFSPNSNFNAYLLLACDIGDSFRIISSKSSNSYNYKFSLYDNKWASVPITDDMFSLKGYFVSSSDSSILKPLTSFYFQALNDYNGYYSTWYFNRSSPNSYGNSLIYLPLYYSNYNTASFYSHFSRSGIVLPTGLNYFSSKYSDLVAFNSLEDFKKYTLDNGVYWKATNVIVTNETSISYETFNQSETTIVNNSEVAYNTINEYITNNNISYIDESTQTIINNEYTYIYNYDVDIDFDFTINNIDNITNLEQNYWNDFNTAFNDSGLKDTSFTSFNGTDFSSPVASTLGIVNIFYNFLPVELKWLLFILFAIGIFGMVIGAIFKSRG